MGLAEFEAQELYLKQLQVILLSIMCFCSTAIDAAAYYGCNYDLGYQGTPSVFCVASH
jgi:hypothetical protein